jgi:Ni,Fe-hydrogenase III large subunit
MRGLKKRKRMKRGMKRTLHITYRKETMMNGSDSKNFKVKEDEEEVSIALVENKLKEWKKSQRKNRGWKRKGGGEGD